MLFRSSTQTDSRLPLQSWRLQLSVFNDDIDYEHPSWLSVTSLACYFKLIEWNAEPPALLNKLGDRSAGGDEHMPCD